MTSCLPPTCRNMSVDMKYEILATRIEGLNRGKTMFCVSSRWILKARDIYSSSTVLAGKTQKAETEREVSQIDQTKGYMLGVHNINNACGH